MTQYLVTQSVKDESVANMDLVLQRPQKRCQRGKSKQAVQPSVYVLWLCHRREWFFIQDNWINVCCQCPNQTTVYCFLSVQCQALHIVRNKTGQGGYRHQFTRLILTTPKLCLTTEFSQSILSDSFPNCSLIVSKFGGIPRWLKSKCHLHSHQASLNYPKHTSSDCLQNHKCCKT